MIVSPFVLEVGPAEVLVDDHFDEQKGVVQRVQVGSHAIWAAHVPFLPALDAEELTEGGSGRINKVVWRLSRFLYDLSRIDEHRATYELRFVVRPSDNSNEPGQVDIVFFGKVFHPTRSQVRATALQLWEKFVSNFPLEDPFNYPLVPVTHPDQFHDWHMPIESERLRRPGTIVEIRRYEDLPDSIGTSLLGPRPASHGDYIVHPFVPTLDFSAMSRFFEALAIQSQPCFASISLRPVRLFEQEIFLINQMAARFREEARESSEIESEFARSRARMGARIYQSLMQEREFLLKIKVQVVGQPAPFGVIEALGSEMMNNGRNPFPTKWVCVTPTEDQQAIALNNLEMLEHDLWGESRAHPTLNRLRMIADVQQAAGAFRLPIPPESGFMPGILVRNEPFTAPQDHLERSYEEPSTTDVMLSLGQIYHRGRLTDRDFKIPLASLTRHSLIAGSTGSGKSTTVKFLLSQLWRSARPIPFLVLYPIDKTDYRDLLSLPGLGDDLLVFTLGDETTVPFRFNPFQVPDGVLLKTHVSRLMRAFSAAMDFFAPLPMIYHRALRAVYEEKGWDIARDRGGIEKTLPTMSDFHEVIKSITRDLQYEGETYGNIRQASEIRIAHLLENAGSVLNVRRSPTFAELLERPVLMELGRVGSQEDISLLMGFLLVMLAGTLEKSNRAIPHFTVVEEAHRLMAAGGARSESLETTRASAGEDFSNILAEVRGHNAGLFIAEQMPVRLVPGATGNTYLKVMHWLEDKESFELFADIMNLSPAQRIHARRLNAGEAIVRNRFGRPVHIRVNVPDALANSQVVSDNELRQRMESRLTKAGLTMPPESNVTTPDTASSRTKDVAAYIFHSPLGRECSFCQSLLATGKCLYGETVDRLLRQERGRALVQQTFEAITRHPGLTSQQIIHFSTVLAQQEGKRQDSGGLGYCALAHIGHQIESAGNISLETRVSVARSLERFPWEEFRRQRDG